MPALPCSLGRTIAGAAALAVVGIAAAPVAFAADYPPPAAGSAAAGTTNAPASTAAVVAHTGITITIDGANVDVVITGLAPGTTADLTVNFIAGSSGAGSGLHLFHVASLAVAANSSGVATTSLSRASLGSIVTGTYVASFSGTASDGTGATGTATASVTVATAVGSAVTGTTTAKTTAAPAGSSLAFTGAAIVPLAAAGIGLTGTGIVLVVAGGRRRRRATVAS